MCGQPIDYSIKWPDPGSFSVEHKRSWHRHPELREDPANLDSAHLGCNSSKGVDSGDLVFAVRGTSEEW